MVVYSRSNISALNIWPRTRICTHTHHTNRYVHTWHTLTYKRAQQKLPLCARFRTTRVCCHHPAAFPLLSFPQSLSAFTRGSPSSPTLKNWARRPPATSGDGCVTGRRPCVHEVQSQTDPSLVGSPSLMIWFLCLYPPKRHIINSQKR